LGPIFKTLQLLYLIVYSKIIRGANIRGFLLLHVKCLYTKIHSPSTVAKRLARHFTFGRSRLLTPVLPDQVSPHHHIVVCLISQISRMLGQYQPLSTYHLPSAPILTVRIPNLPVSVAKKAVESPSSPPPFGGNERCILPSKSILHPV
jgi:hypothetical protein